MFKVSKRPRCSLSNLYCRVGGLGTTSATRRKLLRSKLGSCTHVRESWAISPFSRHSLFLTCTKLPLLPLYPICPSFASHLTCTESVPLGEITAQCLAYNSYDPARLNDLRALNAGLQLCSTGSYLHCWQQISGCFLPMSLSAIGSLFCLHSLLTS